MIKNEMIKQEQKYIEIYLQFVKHGMPTESSSFYSISRVIYCYDYYNLRQRISSNIDTVDTRDTSSFLCFRLDSTLLSLFKTMCAIRRQTKEQEKRQKKRNNNKKKKRQEKNKKWKSEEKGYKKK